MAFIYKHLFSLWLNSKTCFLNRYTVTFYSRVCNLSPNGHCQWICWLGSKRDHSQRGQLGNNLASTSSSSLWKIIRVTNNIFSCLSSHSQNADKLYKGHLSEFTPLASLHALAKPGNQRQGSAHQQNAANSPRSHGFKKKTMFTRWQRTPDYCTFTPLLRFSDGSNCSKQGYPNNGAGPETAVWFLFLWSSLLLCIRYRVKHSCVTNVTKICLCYWEGTFVIRFVRDYN